LDTEGGKLISPEGWEATAGASQTNFLQFLFEYLELWSALVISISF
jgi:hypothetical protein